MDFKNPFSKQNSASQSLGRSASFFDTYFALNNLKQSS